MITIAHIFIKEKLYLPLSFIFLAILFSYFAVNYFYFSKLAVSALYQIIGGLTVFFLIINKLKFFLNKQIVQIFLDLFKIYRVTQKSNMIEIDMAEEKDKALPVYAKGGSIESQVENLRLHIIRIDSEVDTLREEHNEKINEAKLMFDKLNNYLKEVEQKLSVSMIGNVKWELFGIVMIIYGLIIPLL